ncbi:hypothetical protein BABA_05231 [Neobacillus bataviensis LMG 21833]|uniref:Uncharacterized protein n=1 Tax=Neobacillus bataviensis LMG 21833 TaxID=1117379 RepID=K6DQ18_9BACI|nr:hypothetical protein [Neobacillus bataviensis]EKN70424.1 hypothetical protein BABA_05231 [Neobacillus bataviensis LMG 21833]
MQILLHEIKKILTWKMLILLIFVNWIVYFLFIEYDVNYFTNGKNDSYRIGIEMVNKYGIDMDEKDFLDFKRVYNEEVEKANHYLQSKKAFVNAGMGTYENFENNYDPNNKEQNALYQKVFFEDRVKVFWELQERERLIEHFEDKEVLMANERKYAKDYQRIRYDELIGSGYYPVYSGVAIENFERFIKNVAIAIILSVVLLLSPIFIKDRYRRLQDLQYTTRKGRNLYKTKTVAGLISAFMVMTILLIIYFSLYSLHHISISVFFKVPVHMFSGLTYWYDPTFFQYIVLTVIAIYILGFVFSLLAMSFSSIMPNYISLIGIQIPFVMGILIFGLTYLLWHIISIRMPQWVVPISYSVMLVVSVAFIFLIWQREKKYDIVL